MPDSRAANLLVIAIDGPAGAGKSTVTRTIAQRLGLLYLDTGAMYRAATVAVIDAGIDLDNPQAIAAHVAQQDINFNDTGQVCLNGIVQEPRIRSLAITREIYRVADNAACREVLVRRQQAIVAGRSVALEGRDATTVICPQATLKIYLDASAEERARRRLAEWQQADGSDASATMPDLAQVTAEIIQRDQRDQGREVGALTITDDAVHVVTDDLSPQEVIARIMALAIHRRPLVLDDIINQQVRIGRSRQSGYVKVLSGNLADPPGPWQLGLTNPSSDRLPASCTSLTRNLGGRQAGVLCQGRAVLVLAGRDDTPGEVLAVPVLPQTWYIIEPGCWHAVIQTPGTICAWAEASRISEQHAELSSPALAAMRQFLAVYLPAE